MSNLDTMYSKFGVSPWLDNLSRDLIDSGDLQKLIDNGIRGLTSNPSIFEKAFSTGTSYAEPLKSLLASGCTSEDAYWTLAIEDIQSACDLMKPIYDESGGDDGFVSLEVSPKYAHDSAATVSQAKQLWEQVNRPNLMIKIPATAECIPAITEVLALGINVNVTLIFSLHRYLQVITAYLEGLERLSNPAQVRSVASFFISRVDSEIDPKLSSLDLKGLAAVAQAQIVYGIFLESFNSNSERWAALESRGAKHQRPLWASTSIKDPSYPDLKYVDSLLARNSVNTLPNSTIDAIQGHASFGDLQGLSPEQIETAHEDLTKLKVAGIDMVEVSNKLETEGVEKFQKAFSDMLSALTNPN